MKIADMPAGPELDRLVAERVMGWTRVGPEGTQTVYKDSNGGHHYVCPSVVTDGVITRIDFKPSCDVGHAWMVVERVTDISLPIINDGFPPSTVFMHYFQKAQLWAMSSQDAALAICRAALIAVGCKALNTKGEQ